MKAYLDTNVVSAIAKDDNAPESGALTRLLEAREQGKVEVVTSEITLEEIKRVPDRHRPPLERIFLLLEKVPIVRWDELIGMNSHGDKFTWINTPIIDNDPLYSALLVLGLEAIDARHVFVATKQACSVFLTCDNSRRTSILRRAAAIKRLCGVVVQKPSDFVAGERW